MKTAAESSSEAVTGYESLIDIERGFTVLRSEVDIGLIHHRLRYRVRAHTTFCFIALTLFRAVGNRFGATNLTINRPTLNT